MTFTTVEINLIYNFKGIIAVPAKALKAKKILISMIYILIAFFIYNIFTYLALAVDGHSISWLFSRYGFFPFDSFIFQSNVAIILYYYIGLSLTLLSIMTGLMAITAIDFEDLRGNPFFSFSQAFKFGLNRIKQLFFSELSIGLFIGFIILLGIIIGLISRIPFIGEIIYGLFFFFPGFVSALVITVVIFIFIPSILVMPTAVAADRNGETFNSILETFLTLIKQPVRWIGYTSYCLITAKICGFVFAYFSFKAVQLIQFSTHIGGGDKIDRLVASGAVLLPLKSQLVNFTGNLIPGVESGFDISSLARAGTGSDINIIAQYLMAISLFLVFLTVWGYIMSVIATGQAYAFIIIKKIRDGRAITDEKPLFYEEEWVNPPIDENKQ